jgi:hypothetical protein
MHAARRPVGSSLSPSRPPRAWDTAHRGNASAAAAWRRPKQAGSVKGSKNVARGGPWLHFPELGGIYGIYLPPPRRAASGIRAVNRFGEATPLPRVIHIIHNVSLPLPPTPSPSLPPLLSLVRIPDESSASFRLDFQMRHRAFLAGLFTLAVLTPRGLAARLGVERTWV